MPFEAFAAQAGGQILGSVLGRKNAAYGSQMDVDAKLGHESELWSRAKERGLTPQEYYGSSAPGGATGSSGSAQVIGNQSNAASQAASAAAIASREKAKDRATQVEIANINAGVTQRGQDINATTQTAGQDKQFQANMARLNLDTNKYMQTTLPQAAANIKQTEATTRKIINEVATSDPKFQRMMKIMTMGSDNSYGLAIQNMLGVDISDPKQMKSLPLDTRRKLLAGLLSGSSNAAKEFAGFSGNIDSWLDTMVQGGNALIKGAGDLFKPGIEATTPQLGSGKGRYQ